MAAGYQTTKETTNFARICRLAVGVIPDVFRDVLLKRLPTSGLSVVLNNQKHHVFSQLNKQQKNLLYPPGGFQGSVKDLDVSLLYILLRNLGNIQPHRKGWGNVPDSTDRSLSANIDRLRVQRNEAFAHARIASLSDGAFKARFAVIRQSVNEIEKSELKTGSYVVAVDNVLVMKMDHRTTKSYIEELLVDIQGQVNVVRDDVGALKDGVQALRGDVDALREHISADRGNKQYQAANETTKSTVQQQTARQEIIPTQALEDAKDVIRINSVVIIRGASGDGKTMMCYQLLKWLMDGDKNDPGLSKDTLQLYSLCKWGDIAQPKSNLALFIDDVTGDIVENLKRRIDSIQATFCGKLNRRSNCLVWFNWFNVYRQSESFKDGLPVMRCNYVAVM